jgi:hypothetical protein
VIAVRALLHACCGPCLLEPLDALAVDHDVEVVFANPNIHPLAEYEFRRDTLLEYARSVGVLVHELTYDPAVWMRSVAGVEQDQRRRCRACHKLRLEMTARFAAEAGFDAIATTLSVSPYQDADSIRDAGVSAAEQVDVRFLDHDFRGRYPEATRRARGLGMYRQNYCGCQLSQLEAENARRARRARKG